MKRRKARRAALVLALGLALLSALPMTAWGKWTPQIRLHATHGYAIQVSGRGPTVLLSATRPAQHPRPRGGLSTYIARGKASSTAIEATFGDLGKVSVRFQPSGKVKLGRSIGHCPGSNRKVTRYGFFVGDIRFRGEDGYTAVHVHRAKGEIVRRPSVFCQIVAIIGGRRGHADGSSAGGKGKETSLVAAFKSGVVTTEFKATTDRAGTTRFAAATARTEGRLGIYREAFAKAPPQTFDFDSALSFGSVMPPSPFSGSGSLQRNADGSKSWTGPLAVSFPGEPNVPLTGPQFKVQLSQSF